VLGLPPGVVATERTGRRTPGTARVRSSVIRLPSATHGKGDSRTSAKAGQAASTRPLLALGAKRA
jgi:hypothetical protein